jgi:hypothetical protein
MEGGRAETLQGGSQGGPFLSGTKPKPDGRHGSHLKVRTKNHARLIPAELLFHIVKEKTQQERHSESNPYQVANMEWVR